MVLTKTIQRFKVQLTLISSIAVCNLFYIAFKLENLNRNEH